MGHTDVRVDGGGLVGRTLDIGAEHLHGAAAGSGALNVVVVGTVAADGDGTGGDERYVVKAAAGTSHYAAAAAAVLRAAADRPPARTSRAVRLLLF